MSRLRSFAKNLSLRAATDVDKFLSKFAPKTYKNCNLAATNCKLLQLTLANQYRDIAAGKANPLPLLDVEFQAYSQNGEDGILLYIFSLIGVTNKKAVEICAGD